MSIVFLACATTPAAFMFNLSPIGFRSGVYGSNRFRTLELRANRGDKGGKGRGVAKPPKKTKLMEWVLLEWVTLFFG